MYLGSQFWFILWIYSVIVFLISLTKAKLHVLGHCFPVLIKVFHLYQTYLYLKTNNELRNKNNIVCILRDDRYSDLYYSLFSVQEPICYMMHNKLNDYRYSGMLSVLYHTIKSHFLVYCYTHFIWKTLTKSTNLRRILWCIIYCYSD